MNFVMIQQILMEIISQSVCSKNVGYNTKPRWDRLKLSGCLPNQEKVDAM